MRTIVLILVLFLTDVSHAEIFPVDQTRGITCHAEVALEFLTPLVDSFDSGPDKTLDTFNQSESCSVTLALFNKTDSFANQTSGFNLAPDGAIVAAIGASSLNTTVSDPGFNSSRARGFGISLFEWTFSVDGSTYYSLNTTLTSDLFGFQIFLPTGSIDGVIASSYELTDFSSGAVIRSDIAIDIVADGADVSRTSNHLGTLPPGTYQLSSIADAFADVFVDAVIAGDTSFQVDLTLFTVPEPGMGLLLSMGILVVIGLGKLRAYAAEGYELYLVPDVVETPNVGRQNISDKQRSSLRDGFWYSLRPPSGPSSLSSFDPSSFA